MSLTWAPGRQQTSLRVGSGRHIGPSVPLRRELPTTITLLSFLVEAVLRCGVNFLALGNLLGGLSNTSSPTSLSSSKASNVLCKCAWEGKAGRERGSLRHRAGTRSHSSSSPRSLPLPDSDRAGGPPLAGVSHPGAFLSGLAGSCSTSLTPAHTPR